LVDSVERMMMHGLANTKSRKYILKKQKNANATVQISSLAVKTVIKVEFTLFLFQR